MRDRNEERKDAHLRSNPTILELKSETLSISTEWTLRGDERVKRESNERAKEIDLWTERELKDQRGILGVPIGRKYYWPNVGGKISQKLFSTEMP